MGQSILLTLLLPIYGITIMAALLNINRSNFKKEKMLPLAIFTTITITANFLVLTNYDLNIYRKFYAFLVQLPLFLGFKIISEYRGVKLLFTLLTTITLASLPVNFVVIFRILTDNNPKFIILGFLLSFVIMIFLVFKLLRGSYLYMMQWGERKIFWKFSIIPMLYYIYGFLGSGYNFTQYDNFYNYFVGVIPSIIVFVSYILIVDVFKNVKEKQLLKSQQDLIVMQLDASTKQIEELRIKERQSAIYRHDLRHHMNYLNACITKNKFQEALLYIQQTCTNVDNMTIQRYSENEPINLIISSYVAKAKEKDIQIEVNVTTTDFSRFQIIDLCSLLANGIENAIHGCEQVEDSKGKFIRLRIYERNSRLCLEICNSYAVEPVFDNKVPVSQREGHGIGVKSIIYVVEKYEGVYGFSTKDGEFRFQVSM